MRKTINKIRTGVFILACLLSLETMAQETPREKIDTIKVQKEQVIEEQVIIKEPLPDEQVIFMVVEYMPEFPGGRDSMVKFISDSLVYPALVLENNIQSRVLVEFVVDEEGRISNVKVVSKPKGWGLDEAAVEVIKKMPRWNPGKQRGKPVKVRYVVPIRFQLNSDEPEQKPK